MRDDIVNLINEDVESFYGHLVEIKKTVGSEMHCFCCMHDDTNASLHVNVETGAFHCKACQVGGDAIYFYRWVNSCDESDAIDEISTWYGVVKTPVINHQVFHTMLLQDAAALEALQKKRMYTAETIIKYSLGWDGKRYYFPIFDFGGNVRNVKKYLLECPKEENKMMSITGFGDGRIYPVRNTLGDTIYIFEGEPDTLLACQLGLPAVTVTTGARGWKAWFNKYFVDKTVYVCYDVDAAGKEGAAQTANHLLSVAKDVFIIALPPDGIGEKGDFTDFIRLHGEADGLKKFKKLKPRKFTGLDDATIERLIQEVHLAETTNSEFYGKRIRAVAIPTGKGNIYLVPHKGSAHCQTWDSEEAKCAACPLHTSGGNHPFRLPIDNVKNLKLFDITEEAQKGELRRMLRLPKCEKCYVKVKEAINIEECIIIPEIDYNSTNSAGYISRLVYIIGDTSLEPNKPYIFEGIPTPHPKTQKSTILMYKQATTKDNIDDFEMTPALQEQLKVFQASTYDEMRQVLERKHQDYEAITGIYGRHDLFEAVDIIYHSVLSFTFRNQRVKRGYVIGLVYGDTRTAKTETVDLLMQHFRAGDAAGGENISFAGLVGGVHQISEGGKWAITWKIVPLNDRRLVKIDEFHEMKDDDIRKMSELMSTGVASIQKIHSERTMARTRLILVANCKTGKHLSDYQFGCQAITDIMGGHNEDIARLDFAFAVSAGDVDFKLINSRRKEKKEIKTFTSDLSHQLIMWAWSREHKDIIFTPEAEELIVTLAEEEAAKYHGSIPLVPAAEQPVKLARIGAAYAAMFFSTDDGRRVIVKDDHIRLAHEFLESAYGNKSMRFDTYSQQHYINDRLENPKELKAIGITDKVRTLLLRAHNFNVTDLATYFNTDFDSARNKLFVMLTNNAVEKYGTNMYRKTAPFIKFLSVEDFPVSQKEPY